MSDERESADATTAGSTAGDTAGAGNGADSAGQTAVVTPARPTGKRSRQRAQVATVDEAEETDASSATEDAEDGEAKAKSKTKKAKASKAAAGGGILAPFKFVWSYLGQVIAELRKVIWPNRKQMATYTTVVLAFLAFMVALIGFVDLGLAKLVLWVFG